MNDQASNRSDRFQWLTSPWAILVGITAGAAVGILDKEIAEFLMPFGKLFLAMLQMSVLPIMICAVVSSLANLLRSKTASRYLVRIVAVFLFGMIFSASVGMCVGVWAGFGKSLDQRSRDALGKMVMESELGSSRSDSKGAQPESFISIYDPIMKTGKHHPFQDFLSGIVPNNIFTALSQGENLKILFFSIIFGIALATVRIRQTEEIIQAIFVLFKAFENVIGWMMYFLPFGLFCLLAGQVAQVGITIIMALLQFVLMIYVGSIFIVLINGIVIRFMGGTSFVNSYVALRKPLIISFGTRSSFVAMPSAIHAMSEDLKFEKETINLMIPLGITLCRFGTVMAFSFSTVFFAHLYHLQMSPGIYGIILTGTVLAALASAGAPGAATIGMLSLVFNPLGLPVDAAIALMLAVDPLIDPVLTLVNVHTNCACTALIARPAVGESDFKQ
jgi:proton glutamate symport protein